MKDVFKITQKGSSSEAIRMKGNNNMPAGTGGTGGKFDKNGFKKNILLKEVSYR
jgi:hypothetical protein